MSRQLEEFREFVDFMYESIDIEDHQRFIAISESMLKDGWFKWIYRYAKECAERVQELEIYVDENGKKSVELNVFLQKRETTRHLGKHVINAVMGYVQELETQLQASNNVKQRLRQRINELESSEFIGTSMQLAKQNKHYNELLESIRYTQDIADEIFKTTDKKVISPDDLLQHILRKVNNFLEESE